MTSKSPVRSCDDVDEAALSYAEIKALCAGDPRIKERMELDVDVAKLRIMKADHQSQQFQMEDRLLKYFPEQIRQTQGVIKGMEADILTLAAHPIGTETEGNKKSFVGITIQGTVFTDKTEAGKALLEACSGIKSMEPVEVGRYRGFAVLLTRESLFQDTITAILKGEMRHQTELSHDVTGNFLRMDHALEKMPERLNALQVKLDNLYKQQESTKGEVGKPFPNEEELRQKSARLAELDSLLNCDARPSQVQPAQVKEETVPKNARPSVLEQLRRPLPPREKKEAKEVNKEKPRQREPGR